MRPLTILPLTILVATFAFAPLLSPRPAAAERTVEGNRITEGIPQLPKRITDRMRQYQNTRSASVRGWTSDGGSLLISTRFGETNQLHLVSKPGGARSQLTFFDEPVREAAVCPDPGRRNSCFQRMSAVANPTRSTSLTWTAAST